MRSWWRWRTGRRGFPIAEFLECRFAGIDVTELLTFLERETGRVAIDVLNPSWLIFGEGFRRNPVRLLTARSVDLLASAMVLLVSVPAMLLTALAIKFEDGWNAPVLYRQARIGLGGREFHVLKFRSMRTDAERPGQAQWAQTADPRVTRVGALIRKLRVDELPQIFNVVRGDMSFVGPRPERPRVRGESLRAHSVLRRAALREARDHRLGAAVLPLRLIRARRAGEAAIRPLLHQEQLAAV